MTTIESLEELDDVKSSEGVKLLDFYADWCGPCKIMEPILKELDQDIEDFTVYKIDVDASPNIAAEFSVRSIPTMYLINQDGNQVDEFIGTSSEKDLKEAINSLM